MLDCGPLSALWRGLRARGANPGMEDVADLVARVNLYLAGLPRNWRIALYLVAGLCLTSLAAPRFQEKVFTALLFMGLAVFFFWMAIGALL